MLCFHDDMESFGIIMVSDQKDFVPDYYITWRRSEAHV